MSLTVAEQLFGACVLHEDLTTLTKIERKWLSTQEFTQYQFLTDYYKDHAELPGLKLISAHFDKRYKDADGKPKYYLAQLQNRFTLTTLQEEVPKIMATARKDPQSAREALITVTVNATARESKTTDKNYADKTDDRKSDYASRKENKGVSHLSTGNEVLDKVLLGYNPTDLVTFGGRAGSKKTWLLCFLALLAEAVIPEDMGPLLFITNEISIPELELRMDAIRFRLAYGRFLRGELNKREELRYMAGLDALKKRKSRLVIIHNCRHIDEFADRVNLYKPALAMIDGSYLMEPERELDYKKIAYITQNLKLIAGNTFTPTLNTTQMTRGGGKGEKKTSFDAQDEFAFGNSYVQDSDAAFRMYQTPEMVYDSIVGLEVAKGRRVEDNTRLAFHSNLESMKLDITNPATAVAPTAAPVEY
jgi:hypothetical protein